MSDPAAAESRERCSLACRTFHIKSDNRAATVSVRRNTHTHSTQASCEVSARSRVTDQSGFALVGMLQLRGQSEIADANIEILVQEEVT